MKTVPLNGKKAAGRFALVDDEDYDLVMQHRWHVWEQGRHGPYVAATITRPDGCRTTTRMHNLIMGTLSIDHQNGDGLDNRRANLRPATQSQNNANQRRRGGTSSYKGVYWDRANQRWKAQISIDGRMRHLGNFLAEDEAARAYDVAAVAAWGEFAATNGIAD